MDRTQAKKNRASGKAFELKVRKDLEDKGWHVSKYQNNVSDVLETDIGEYDRKLISCKPKFNPFTKALMMNSGGFPDFVATKVIMVKEGDSAFLVHGVECKSLGYLSDEEKKKCEWLLDRHVFGKIIIAYKGKKRGEIVYEEFKSKKKAVSSVQQ